MPTEPHEPLLGTTSACAENTRFGGYQHRTVRNYLRVRGEYHTIAHQLHYSRELPPRARRILGVWRTMRGLAGTTSACAENTPRSLKTVPGCGNYLRVRGEYLRTIVSGFSVAELPPRARRILRPPPPHSSRIGTTSACAENTEGWPETLGFCWNYLRVRGEYFPRPRLGWYPWELPPRARRIHPNQPRRGKIPGTTSACAENTTAHLCRGFSKRNYLRVRGEYLRVHAPYPLQQELPPRARRIRWNHQKLLSCYGTTSACAENTGCGHGLCHAEWNYLRVRGEYTGN